MVTVRNATRGAINLGRGTDQVEVIFYPKNPSAYSGPHAEGRARENKIWLSFFKTEIRVSI